MPPTTRDELPSPPYESLARSTQELPLHAVEFDSAMRADRARLQRQAILRQRWIRVATALGLAILSGSSVSSGVARAIIAVLVVAYSAIIATVGGMIARGPDDESHDGAVMVLVVADAIVISTLGALGRDAMEVQCVLLIGALMVPMTTFSLGQQFGVVAAVVLGIGYLVATGALWALGVWPRADLLMVGLEMVFFAAGCTILIRTLGGFRHRMDALRMYCKVAELGDVGAAIPLDTTREPDELTLLAASFDSMRNQLAEQIGSDPLTGCANRRTLQKRLLADWRFARRRSSTVAVAVIDIDHFKQINDTRGHPVGDLVLQQIASIMMVTARDTDTVARPGGDEFVIVLPDTDWQGATSFAERLRSRVMEYTFGPSDAALAITISVGVAIGDSTAPIAPDALLAEADRSLYRAKTEGRNRVSA